MRLDQIERMRTLQEALADVFFVEGDPKDWPAMDTKDGRGDRYWHKKNASATLALIGRIENLLALRDGRASGGPTPDQTESDEASLDKEIAAATKEAERLGREAVERVRKRAAKTG